MKFILFFLLFILFSFILCDIIDEQRSFLGKKIDNNWEIIDDKYLSINDINISSYDSLLIASPNSIYNNEDIIVSWSGIENASENDWIGIYCPPTGNDINYLDRLYTNTSSSSGSLRFENLINMRCEYGFKYYRGEQVNGRYELVVSSNNVSMINGNNEVMQVHMSLTSNPSDMIITWVTGSNLYDSYVEYGYEKNNLNHTSISASSLTTTYYADQMCGSPANITSQQTFRDPGWIHNVKLSELKPNTTYFYRCGNPYESWSDIYWLHTSPNSLSFSDNETANINTNIIIYGDMGVSSFYSDTYYTSPPESTTSRVTNEIFKGSTLVLHIGDLSYARGFGYMWEQFFNMVQSITAHVPYMINMGNHEYDHLSGGENDPSNASGEGFHPSWGNMGDDSSGECSVPMYYRFNAPNNGNSIYWYSFDYGNIHMIMMSTEHNFTKGSPQYKWIENDLKQVNRNKTPFIIFNGHRAMYESQQYFDQWKVEIGLRYSLEDLLYEYQVDIAFWGHFHAYERTCPVYKGKCDPNGTIHIVVGTAGFYLTTNPQFHTTWSEAFILDFGYCKISTTRDTMTVQFIHNENESIGDEVILTSRF